MEIEKTLLLNAPPARVWDLLLDPNAMGACVPGMQSIDVLSSVEYVAHIHVTIFFMSAKFKLKTRIADMRALHYLRAEGTGEDTSVASSPSRTAGRPSCARR
ncbi:Carbon monoxide dehydrogenase subunit G (CoxG) [Noviherbaspirillum humi]|uniref:Carbon monoxide dehydrogenase subunit G (CoxG) n=1 Tax=Noviherbaspirillum humi TaxID=1688639 RepID=A0A239L9X3_9BURK|nr:SRPBCC domain-containing protein [Noviherbaspirillum humi]SNT27447.1 Carbon monoxide dehydrogenase subunit G (CoxG) [Noviherbaspirillum humi]